MAKFNKKKYNKPVRYTTRSGKTRNEYLPRDWPEWFYRLVTRWLWYKHRNGRDWYYYEVRLTLQNPVDRKFDDLWFLDHLDRDHSAINPLLWHERLLKRWLLWLYAGDIAWFDGMLGTKLTKRQNTQVANYGYRYYPIGFNASMRLIYHGCTTQDYFDAVDRKYAMMQETLQEWEENARRRERSKKRRKAKEAREKKV
jgi:hypothetical protein